jgi:urease accessory protein
MTLHPIRPSTRAGLGAAALWLVASPAVAHHAMDGGTPETFAQGLLSGLAHPIIGADHALFLLAAGLVAALLPLGQRLLLPGLFVAFGLIGTGAHLAQFSVTGSEALVALSVAVMGLVVLSRHRLAVGALAVFFAAAGLVHGYAYAESVVGAEPMPLGAYLLGFSVVQYAVILGIAAVAARLIRGRGQAALRGAYKVLGGMVTALGGLLLLGQLAA